MCIIVIAATCSIDGGPTTCTVSVDGSPIDGGSRPTTESFDDGPPAKRGRVIAKLNTSRVSCSIF
jgi:hypothetical protein